MVNISERSINKFLQLRLKVFELIKKALEIDSYSKSYEGILSIHFPNYFEDMSRCSEVSIELGCYVLGPHRRHTWTGETFDEAMNLMAETLCEWEETLEDTNDEN